MAKKKSKRERGPGGRFAARKKTEPVADVEERFGLMPGMLAAGLQEQDGVGEIEKCPPTEVLDVIVPQVPGFDGALLVAAVPEGVFIAKMDRQTDAVAKRMRALLATRAQGADLHPDRRP